jgi:hypothetical protein
VLPGCSLDLLAPDNNMFIASVESLPLEHGVLFHSLIVDRGKGGFLDHRKPTSSDGVVPYWSSHHRTGGTSPYGGAVGSGAALGDEKKPYLAPDAHQIVCAVQLLQSGCKREGVRFPDVNGPEHDQCSEFRNHRNINHPNSLIMLYTIAVILIVLWLLGLVTGYTMGAFIHVLLVIAIIMVLLNLISGRRV